MQKRIDTFLFCARVFIDKDGKIHGKHRKLMPTLGERTVRGLGGREDIRVFDAEIGTVGGSICYEHHMTLLKAAMHAHI